MPKSKQKQSNGSTLGIEAILFAAADKLRGHLDAAEYKNVVLGLIFLKYISDAFEKLHTELSVLAQKSQEIHQKMVAKIEEAKKIKEEADTVHNSCLLAREKARQLEEELRKLAGEKRKLRDSERQIQESRRQQDAATRKTAEKALKEKLESQAREKLQRGEKLSWDEFQLLAEEDDSETQG